MSSAMREVHFLADWKRAITALLAGIFVLLTAASASGSSASFPDVPADHPNAEAITFLALSGAINGYPDGTFQPDVLVSRVEALKIFLVGSQIDVPQMQSSFPDVPTTHWGQKYIAEAAKRGVVNGHPDGSFRPEDRVSRAGALKMLLLVQDISPPTPANAPFADAPLDEWFTPFASYAKAKHLLDAGERLEPAEQLSRGQIAELMYRLEYIRQNELDAFRLVSERPARIASVYDGDTVTTDQGEKIRIIGINTPEKGELLDPEATALMEEMVLGQRVTLHVCATPRDRYGRTLARLEAPNGADPAAALLEAGLARAYFLGDCGADIKDQYQRLEQRAQAAGVGIWEGLAVSADHLNGLWLQEAHANQESRDALNTEYIVLKNSGAENLFLGGLVLSDEQNHRYDFPEITMKASATLTIFTGEGETTNTEWHLGLSGPIWNNSGDMVQIFSSTGELLFSRGFKGNVVFEEE